MWHAYERILYPISTGTPLVYTTLPDPNPHVTWLLDGSAWLQAHNTPKTLRDLQRELFGSIPLGGTLVLALDLAALLPLHLPLHATHALADAKANLRQGRLASLQHCTEVWSGQAAEASPLLHWQWLRALGESIECPRGFKQLELTHCVVLPGFDDGAYAELRIAFKKWLTHPGTFTRQQLGKLVDVPDFIDNLVDHLIAQQLIASNKYCQRVLKKPDAKSENRTRVKMDVTDLTIAATKEAVVAQAFAQLLPRVLDAFTQPNAVVVLVCVRPDALALLISALALKHKNSPADFQLPHQRCFLRLITGALVDVGAFYNTLALRVRRDFVPSRIATGLLTWVLLALLSRDDTALCETLWELQTRWPCFEAERCTIDHDKVREWYLGAWQKRLVPASDLAIPCFYTMLHNASAYHIPIPRFRDTNAIVARVYVDAFERSTATVNLLLNSILFAARKELCKYGLTAVTAATPEQYVALVDTNEHARRFYISLSPSPESPLLTCWTLTPAL